MLDFGMQHCVMVLYQVSLSKYKFLGQKCPAPGVLGLKIHRQIFKNLLPQNHLAPMLENVFSIVQWIKFV